MTPEQADEILDAVVNSRASTRDMMRAERRDQPAATAADDEAFKLVVRLITEATR